MTADSLTFVCHADSFPCFVVFKWCKAKQSALTEAVILCNLTICHHRLLFILKYFLKFNSVVASKNHWLAAALVTALELVHDPPSLCSDYCPLGDKIGPVPFQDDKTRQDTGFSALQDFWKGQEQPNLGPIQKHLIALQKVLTKQRQKSNWIEAMSNWAYIEVG